MLPLTCQPLALHPLIPIFHIIGSVSVNKSLPGGLEFEHINDANGIFSYKGVWHVFHQCCQNHWDHVVSSDLVHWKRLPSPVHPDAQHWYDSRGSFDGSSAILPGIGPVLLVDDIGPFKPPTSKPRGVAVTDNPGCQGLSWPLNLSDPELTHWSKDPKNPIVIDNLACGTNKGQHSRGAFPGSIWQSGEHYNYLSFGYRFTTNDTSLHEWQMVPEQMLSNRSAFENGGQWFLRTPAPLNASHTAAVPPSRPTHLVSCAKSRGDSSSGSLQAAIPAGDQWCLGSYDNVTESWSDFPEVPKEPDAPYLQSDFGPDANFFTAGYASGGIGEPESGDRLLTIGWATQLGFDPLHMKHSYDRSGGLTVPRELNYDDTTQRLLTNPVAELAALRNGTIASEEGVHLTPSRVHTMQGTGDGAAASADIEVEFALPPSGKESAVFSVIVLANKGYVVGDGGNNISSGVTVTLAVSARQPDGTRIGTATISAVGAAPCLAASPYCQNSTIPENGRPAKASFAVLAGEVAVALRILVDRVLVEAFVQHGRVAFTKSFIPQRWQDSAVHLLAGGEATVNKAAVWSMGCGWVEVEETRERVGDVARSV